MFLWPSPARISHTRNHSSVPVDQRQEATRGSPPDRVYFFWAIWCRPPACADKKTAEGSTLWSAAATTTETPPAPIEEPHDHDSRLATANPRYKAELRAAHDRTPPPSDTHLHLSRCPRSPPPSQTGQLVLPESSIAIPLPIRVPSFHVGRARKRESYTSLLFVQTDTHSRDRTVAGARRPSSASDPGPSISNE